MAVHGDEVTGEGRRVSTAGAARPLYRRQFPKEPYPAISMSAAVLLGGAMMLFLAFFGLVGVFLGGSPFPSKVIFTLLSGLGVVMPLVGIRALFGSHLYSVVALTAIGVLLFMGGWFAEPLGGAGLTVRSRARRAGARRRRLRLVEVGYEEPARRLAYRRLISDP